MKIEILHAFFSFLAGVQKSCPKWCQSILLVSLLTLGSAVSLTSSSLAQDSQAPAAGTLKTPQELELTRRANSIARQTMSPFCPGRTLADCPSPNAAAWRGDIRNLLAEGRSAEEIQREFERRTGGDLSGIPNREVSYTFPIALTVGAAALLMLIFSGMVRRRSSPQKIDEESAMKKDELPELPEISDERLAEELENLD